MPIYFLIAGLAIIFDQVSKLWILNNFTLYESRPVIADLFNLVYVTNKGAAFSMLANVESPFRHYFFLVVGGVACIGLTWACYTFSREHKLYAVSLGLIAGGAIGNLIDRVRLGAVVDFLDFYFGSYHWPAFNIADSCICVGVGLFMILSIITNKKEG